MVKLLSITIICILLAVLSHKTSSYDPVAVRYVRRERFFACLIAIYMILFVGLRGRYNDTGTYKQIYEGLISNETSFSEINWELGANPGFTLTNLILIRFGFSTQSYLMFYAAITVGIYIWFIHRYSDQFWLSIIFYFTMGCFTFPLAAIKQCVAVAFCMLAVHAWIKGRKLQFLLWVIVAMLYHPYAVMYAAVPLLSFQTWTWKTYIMLIAFAICGFALENLFGTIADVVGAIGEEYEATELSGAGVNPFRLAVVAVPTLLSFICRKQIRAENTNTDNLILNLSILNAEIMFIALFGTANYFARLANYFLIFQPIALPRLFTHFEKRSRRLLTGAAIACYFLYFYYANAIDQPFDGMYNSISVIEYFKSLF